MPYPQIILKTKKDQSLRRFHPWVFSGAVKKMDDNIPEGAIVEVVSNRGEYLGTGHYQVGSIIIKLFSFEQMTPDREFWKNKIERAVNLRRNLGLFDDPETNVFRLIHAEGDSLPGLIADYYNGTVVIQTPSIGMHLLKDELVEIFKEVLGDDLRAIYDKSEKYIPAEAQVTVKNGYLYGEENAIKEGIEYGCKFRIDWETGQKTGFFIDQRENRKLLGQYSKGKKVLNTFCYSGGFSIAALKAGAAEVHSLDSSAKAMDLVEENLTFNGFDGKNHRSIKADAVTYIKDIEEDYDVIVLDPPAFAKHQNAKHKAVQGYKRLNANAMSKIKSGGLLFTFSCSQAVNKQLFYNTITAAAISVGRKARVLHQLGQPADHPVSIFHPEGEYLKGLVVQID